MTSVMFVACLDNIFSYGLKAKTFCTYCSFFIVITFFYVFSSYFSLIKILSVLLIPVAIIISCVKN